MAARTSPASANAAAGDDDASNGAADGAGEAGQQKVLTPEELRFARVLRNDVATGDAPLKPLPPMRASNAISQKELDNARAQSREAAAKLRSNQDQLNMKFAGVPRGARRDRRVQASGRKSETIRQQARRHVLGVMSP